MQVRDTILGQSDPVPRGQINREYFVNHAESSLSTGVTVQEEGGIRGNVLGADGQQSGPSSRLRGAGGGSAFSSSLPNNPKARELLQKLARCEPYYERNRAKICSFFVKGECRRGKECPYRHEMPSDKESAPRTNIMDRYHGTRDPVAQKMLSTMGRKGKDAPSSSLFLIKLPDGSTGASVTQVFETEANKESGLLESIRSVVMVKKNNCAFVNFNSTQAAAKGLEFLRKQHPKLNAKYARYVPDFDECPVSIGYTDPTSNLQCRTNPRKENGPQGSSESQQETKSESMVAKDASVLAQDSESAAVTTT